MFCNLTMVFNSGVKFEQGENNENSIKTDTGSGHCSIRRVQRNRTSDGIGNGKTRCKDLCGSAKRRRIKISRRGN